jgi:hypothetical protein
MVYCISKVKANYFNGREGIATVERPCDDRSIEAPNLKSLTFGIS